MMDDDVVPSTDGQGLTRRGLLAVVGSSALAGCGSLDVVSGDSESTISVYDIPDIERESVPRPVIAPSVPVEIAPTELAGARDRVNALLSELPTPMGPAAIPNGHVRQHLTDAADDATDGLDDARTARTDLQALQSLQHAREHARYAAEGWAVADDGQSVAPLRSAYEQTRSAARSFGESYEYIGDDPVRATLIHARVEGTLDRITHTDPPRTGDEGQVLTVAEWGETAESVQAQLAESRHLASQFAASLPETSGTVRGELTQAAETVLADTQARRAELPPEPTAEDWDVSDHVRHHIRRDVDDGPASVTTTNGPASAIVLATEQLAHFRALERAQERIEAGELTTVETGQALRDIRSTAYDELAAALEASPAPGLARSVLTDISWRVSQADIELARISRDVSPERLDDVVVDYHIPTLVARAVPAACRQTVDALDTA